MGIKNVSKLLIISALFSGCASVQNGIEDELTDQEIELYGEDEEKSGAGWRKRTTLAQGQPEDPSFGESVSFTRDGNTALVTSNSSVFPRLGNLKIYSRNGSRWGNPQHLSINLPVGGPANAITVIKAKISGDGASIAAAVSLANGDMFVQHFRKSRSGWIESQILPPVPLLTNKRVYSIALSDNGNVVLVGTEFGGAILYTLERGQFLASHISAPRGARNRFASAVTVSADGNTYAVLNPGNNSSFAIVYDRLRRTSVALPFVDSGSVIDIVPDVSEEERLRFAEGAIALSGDGKTLFASRKTDDAVLAYRFTQNKWNTPKKLDLSNTFVSHFGSSIDLSTDGNTAIVAATGGLTLFGDGTTEAVSGAAYIYAFSRTSGTWSVSKSLSLPTGTFEFGRGIAISGDGKRALIGASGKAFIYNK